MTKPNFTGTWRFSPERSVLHIPGPDSTVFVIDHREPIFRFSRTHVVQGKSDTIDLQLTTDGEEIVGEHGGLRFRSRAFWEDETLVFETHLMQEGNEEVNTVRYKLDNTGDLLLADESLRGRTINYDNQWVLTRSKTQE